MATFVQPFSEEQTRILINLQQQYEVWMEAERALAAMPYNLVRKEVNGHSYLYEVKDRANNARSLGPWSGERAATLEAYKTEKTQWKERRDASKERLDETCRLYRSLRLPLMANSAGAIVREADRRGLLGTKLIVVGTNTMPAYHIEAAGLIRELPDETQDCDLAWTGTELDEGSQPIWEMLKAVDSTFTINTERSFQARNAQAYEVEILAAPSRIGTIFRTDRPMPIPLPEQEWLLNGRSVDHVVVCRDGQPARIVAPDPRWFALQKLWMAEQTKRNALKRPKDRKQGIMLLDAVKQAMPLYPVNDAFEAALPGELSPLFDRWKLGNL
ncbi:nucleotidyltransferase domain-containing protein [Novosphingobium sp. G106]|uniref:GSU2403 family nucleotidyltransferase fold protein n=1 Tax=Novosphingobium sp. G106 TaxID=2849500 RepID=UPI001C2D5DEE|nr:GSU2403 family nucleotidyltransferase fold protein [Novosphingobium sp. G106]MBV1687710.1 nucleotidyltransferase domain-containing protein [Novosphingobium sp. G106]